MSSHHRRERCCGDCLTGQHDMGTSETWRTDFLFLVRRQCACEHCDCTFSKVSIMYPRYDQRHHQPYIHRKRRIGRWRAAA